MTQITATDETYQGWSNRETWCVSLWLNNEQALQEGAQEACRSDEDIHLAAHALEAYCDELISVDGMMLDLINCALARANWVEIAESFREYA